MHMHVNLIMENQIIDAELVNSSMSNSMGSSVEHLKAPTIAKSKVWKHFGLVTNEAGVILSKTHVLFVNMTSAFVETLQI